MVKEQEREETAWRREQEHSALNEREQEREQEHLASTLKQHRIDEHESMGLASQRRLRLRTAAQTAAEDETQTVAEEVA